MCVVGVCVVGVCCWCGSILLFVVCFCWGLGGCVFGVFLCCLLVLVLGGVGVGWGLAAWLVSTNK